MTPYKACKLLSVVLLLAFTSASLAQERFVEGTHYERLPKEVPTESGDKVEVAEVFWYGCPHCFSLEPLVEKWLQNKPEEAEFVRVPSALGRRPWLPSVRAYYTAEKLGVLEEMHKAMMEAIHVKQRDLTSPEKLKAFFAEHGIKGEDFDSAYQSFEVETKVRRSLDLMRRYQITSVPTLIVNGKYKTGGSMAGRDLFDVIDFLVKKESGAS